jgi:transcriptional regulator with XRE-family HTH domain
VPDGSNTRSGHPRARHEQGMPMPHAIDLTRLRQLLAQGASQRAMAEALGVSRSSLQRLLRAMKTPAPAPSPPTLRQILRRLERLETTLRQGQPPPGLPAPREPSIRWTVHVPRSLAQQVRTLAAKRRLPPGHVVQEALRRWLADP